MDYNQTKRYQALLKERQKLKLLPGSNPKAVQKLLADLEENIWAFQAVNEPENRLIILGLQELILKIQHNNL